MPRLDQEIQRAFMNEFSWQAVYYSDLQSLYALLLVPIAFLAWRCAAPSDASRAQVPDAAPFVAALTLVFAFETMLDPIATGPIAHSRALQGTWAATLIPFLFVLLGDLRVLLLAIGVARTERSLKQKLGWAIGTTLIVPVATGLLFGLVRWVSPDAHGQLLWMIYEFGFFSLCVFLSRVWVPRSLELEPARADYLRAVLGYSAAYYALWLIADVFIVCAGLDLGWAIRMIPNQLYYAFWTPFVYWRFFSLAPRPERIPPARDRRAPGAAGKASQ